MSYSINVKGRQNPKDPQLVKLEMIFFKTGYARVSKVLSMTGLLKDWEQETQTFKSGHSESIAKNKQLLDLKTKYLRVVEKWEEEGTPWSPQQWSHYFDDSEKRESDQPKVITVKKWMENYIAACLTTERVKNGNIITNSSTAKGMQALMNDLDIFTNKKYGKSFSSYYFQDIKEQFVKDYVSYLELKSVNKNSKISQCGTLRRFRGVCSNAMKMGIPGATNIPFRCVELKMKWPEVTPKTLPYEVFRQIEELDRDLLNKEEQFCLDLFLFSYYGGGIGNKEVCYLTWDCIVDNTLIYERMKTPKTAKMPLTEKAWDIINKYKGKSVGNYVFPVFSDRHVTKEQKENRAANMTMKVNGTLQIVRGIIQYPQKITWYSARGTFITRMIDSGLPATVVAEFAGNSPTTIFRNYWKNTKGEEIREHIDNFI